jgi:pilus assembly protein Flp/PilA
LVPEFGLTLRSVWSREDADDSGEERITMLLRRRRLGVIADTRAVTAIEYALIGSLIAVAIIAAVGGLGTNVAATFTTLAANL